VAVPPRLEALVRRSADPGRVEGVLDRLEAEDRERVAADDDLARAVVAVAAASGWMGRLLVADDAALDVLAVVDQHADDPPRPVPDDDVGDDRALARWWRHEQLRVAARDLTDQVPLETTMRSLSAGAGRVLAQALRLAGADHLAVVGLGKAGGGELNYASDVDVVLVGPTGGDDDREAARRALAVARAALRVDVDLRPGGRDGALVRTVDGYRAHWERWAEPWERQALLKARPLAGDTELGAAFVEAAATTLWERPFDAEDLHAVRAMKARTERHALATDGPDDVKRTPGGIRDIEFSAQLLQLVHGPLDPALRVRGTLPALTALADGGYVDDGDARWLRASYRLLRRVEHAVQLDEGRQVHAVPAGRAERERLARVLGLADRPQATAVGELDRELAACRQTVRSIHERLYFRPLLESFTRVDAPLSPAAAATRLAAFGFADADRTRQAVSELTAGLTRSSRLMAALLPLVLDWLSAAPDPDRGLLALRTLVAADARAVATACRESPETARRLSVLAGTSPLLVRGLAQSPDLLARLGAAPEDDRAAVIRRVRAAGTRGGDPEPVRTALRRAVRRELTRIGIAEVLDGQPVAAVGSELATVAHAAVDVAVRVADPQVPFAVLALGRLAGGELAYASDLDLLLVHDAADEAGRTEAARAGEVVRRVLRGTGPADRVYEVDLDLRPGGRSGALVPSREAVVAHLRRWVEPWQRLALTRLRPLSGDADLADRLFAEADPLVRRPPDDGELRAVRRIKARVEAERTPPGEDARFHLKLGPGGLADVELTVALLLWQHGIREAATGAGIAALATAGHLTADEAATLAAAHAFCERTRNRLTLVAGRGHDALPTGVELVTLARALDTTGATLRDEYLRVTRRARRVVERRFYGVAGSPP
jgi:glutamate-ammonia-ligase adenylyltransferase